jgi:biotin synthase
MIAVARILMPRSHVRLSAGREAMDEPMQALCFFAGANSIFYGEKLLTTANPEADRDRQLFDKLGIRPQPLDTPVSPEAEAGQLARAVTEHARSQSFYDAAG